MIFFLKIITNGQLLNCDDDKQKICTKKVAHTNNALQSGIYRTAQTEQNTMKSSASFPHQDFSQIVCFVSFDVVSMQKFLITLSSRTFME